LGLNLERSACGFGFSHGISLLSIICLGDDSPTPQSRVERG